MKHVTLVTCNVIPTETYDRVEACNTCYNVIPTETYDRVEACNTCYNVIPTETYNIVEACNTCYNVIPTETRNSTLQLSKPSSKASGHKGIAYLAPSIWNELPSDMKLIPNLNTFKHKLKKWFLENLKKEEQNIYTN